MVLTWDRSAIVGYARNVSRHYRGAITYTEPLYQRGIPQAHVGIREHILALLRLVSSLTSGLIVDANDHQSFVRDCIHKVLTADLDRVHGLRNGGEERK
jgi:phosphoenolpyruvate carboxylase